MKILVTAGATREPLDDVRFFSNISTGATGAALADALAARGHEVTLLRGTGAVVAKSIRDSEEFSSAADLLARLTRRLAAGEIEVVIMAAAVADYRPAGRREGKISSEAEELAVRLVRNPKILPQLKALSRVPLCVVGFKLTAGADEAAQREAVARQWAAGGIDATVHNDLSEIDAAGGHPFRLWTSPHPPFEYVTGVPALAVALARLFEPDAPKKKVRRSATDQE